jgi:alanine dehydrogenase
MHHCVTKIPGVMPRTSTIALTNATFAYARETAALGLEEAVAPNPFLKGGVIAYGGHMVCNPVTKSQGLACTDLDDLSGRENAEANR